MEFTSKSKKIRRVVNGLVILLVCLVQIGAGQQIPRPGGGSAGGIPPATPTPAQAVAAAQYYASAVNQSPPKPIPPPSQQGPTQQQLQQQYLLQQQRQKQAQQQAAAQQRERERQHQQQQQQQQQPQIIYQPKVVQAPPKSNQLRAQQPSRGPPQRQQPQQQQQQQLQGGNSQESYEYEDEEEPDRLTQLLVSSKFQCTGKKDGYYADESLACEVFHYCHDNVKHSWMCPNQFMFHQVHLICVPPSSENICKQSSSFHFVNEYLYRPINVKEVERNQNVSLRYGDRYYPEGYAVGLTPFDDQYLLGESGNRVTLAPAPEQVRQQHHGQQQQQHQHRGKVYYSADSVNIPLSQRRPTSSSPVASSRQPPVAIASHSHSEEEYDYE